MLLVDKRESVKDMSFTIRYNKTGKEITVSNTTIWLHLTCRMLDKLGFKAAEVWDK